MKKRKKIFSKTPFIIAEISEITIILSLKQRIIKSAKKIGVDAIKFQTIDPNKITFNSDSRIFKINNKNNLWSGSRLFDLYKKSSMSLEYQKKLFKYTKSIGILAFIFHSSRSR